MLNVLHDRSMTTNHDYNVLILTDICYTICMPSYAISCRLILMGFNLLLPHKNPAVILIIDNHDHKVKCYWQIYTTFLRYSVRQHTVISASQTHCNKQTTHVCRMLDNNRTSLTPLQVLVILNCPWLLS